MERELRDRINQSLMNESTYPQSDITAQEDELFFRLAELVEGGMITSEEGEECLMAWRNAYGITPE